MMLCVVHAAERPNELPVPFCGQGQYSHQVGMTLTPGVTPQHSGLSYNVVSQNLVEVPTEFIFTPAVCFSMYMAYSLAVLFWIMPYLSYVFFIIFEGRLNVHPWLRQFITVFIIFRCYQVPLSPKT